MIYYCLPGTDYSSAMIDGPVPRVGDEVRFRDMRPDPELLTDPLLPDSTFRVSSVSHHIVLRTGTNSDDSVYVYLEDVP